MLSRKEREKLGLVGKVEEIDPETGKKHIVDYDSEDEIGCTASIFTIDEWLKLQKQQSRVKERIYSDTGEVVKEILREDDSLEE